MEIFRAVAGNIFEQGDPGNVAAVDGAGGDLVTDEEWDAEGPLETVQTGQSVVGLVVSGLGICKVVGTNEPGDPRCFREAVNALGSTRYKDISSFRVALAIEPVVNGFKPQDRPALKGLSNVLRGTRAPDRLDTLIAFCSGGEEPLVQVHVDDVGASEMLTGNRMLLSFLSAVSSSAALFGQLRLTIADLLLSIRPTVESYHTPLEGTDGSAQRYQAKWGDPQLSPSQLRERFVAAYPDTPENLQVTGAFFPGLLRCRPNAFATTEEAELGTCAKH